MSWIATVWASSEWPGDVNLGVDCAPRPPAQVRMSAERARELAAEILRAADAAEHLAALIRPAEGRA